MTRCALLKIEIDAESVGSMMKMLKVAGKKVLYLEFDGVLHHGDIWRHPRRAALLWPKGR